MSPELVGEGGRLNSCARKCDRRILKKSPNNEGMCKKMRSSNFEKNHQMKVDTSGGKR